MRDLPAIPYALISGEPSVISVANLTRKDAQAFCAIARQAGVRTRTTVYPLTLANTALDACVPAD